MKQRFVAVYLWLRAVVREALGGSTPASSSGFTGGAVLERAPAVTEPRYDRLPVEQAAENYVRSGYRDHEPSDEQPAQAPDERVAEDFVRSVLGELEPLDNQPTHGAAPGTRLVFRSSIPFKKEVLTVLNGEKQLVGLVIDAQAYSVKPDPDMTVHATEGRYFAPLFHLESEPVESSHGTYAASKLPTLNAATITPAEPFTEAELERIRAWVMSASEDWPAMPETVLLDPERLTVRAPESVLTEGGTHFALAQIVADRVEEILGRTLDSKTCTILSDPEDMVSNYINALRQAILLSIKLDQPGVANEVVAQLIHGAESLCSALAYAGKLSWENSYRISDAANQVVEASDSTSEPVITTTTEIRPVEPFTEAELEHLREWALHSFESPGGPGYGMEISENGSIIVFAPTKGIGSRKMAGIMALAAGLCIERRFAYELVDQDEERSGAD